MRERGRGLGGGDGRIAGGLLDGGAVHQGLGKGDRKFRLPAQKPILAKRTAARTRSLEAPPRHLDHIEPVKKKRFGQAALGSKIERDLSVEGFRFELEPLLPAGKVDRERHLRHALVDRADAAAGNQLAFDDRHRRRLAEAKRRAAGSPHLLEPGQGEVADSGERFRQPRRFDHRCRRCRAAAPAEKLRDPHLPTRREAPRREARRRPLGPKLAPDMRVPAGGNDARAVAACGGEPCLSPGNPRHRDFCPRQAFEELAVLGRRTLLPKSRHVPCSADDGYRAFRLPERSGNCKPHMRLTQFFDPLIRGVE